MYSITTLTVTLATISLAAASPHAAHAQLLVRDDTTDKVLNCVKECLPGLAGDALDQCNVDVTSLSDISLKDVENCACKIANKGDLEKCLNNGCNVNTDQPVYDILTKKICNSSGGGSSGDSNSGDSSSKSDDSSDGVGMIQPVSMGLLGLGLSFAVFA